MTQLVSTIDNRPHLTTARLTNVLSLSFLPKFEATSHPRRLLKSVIVSSNMKLLVTNSYAQLLIEENRMTELSKFCAIAP